MGVYKEGKNWKVQVYYKDWQGNRKRKQKRGFRTKGEAKEWERDFLQQQTQSVEIEFGNFLELYYKDMEVRLRENTMYTKRYIIDLKIKPYFEHKVLSEITVADIRNWQNELLKQNYSETYLKTINCQLGAIFNYAVRYYNLKDNPCRKAGSIGKSKGEPKDFWMQDEFETFLETVDDKPEAKMAFQFLYWTGMRIGELLALTYNDINLEEKTVSVNKSYQRLKGKDVITRPKTPKSIRVITLPDFLVEEFQEYCSHMNPIRPDKTGTLEDFLEKSERYLDEKTEQMKARGEYKPLAKVEELEEANYNMIDNVLNNMPPKKEPFLEYYAAECDEYHSLGKIYKSTNLDEIVAKYREIIDDPTLIYYGNGMGIIYRDPNDTFYDEAEVSLISRKSIRGDNLDDVAFLAALPMVHEALEKIVEAFPDFRYYPPKELNVHYYPEKMTADELATALEQLAEDFDHYDYHDNFSPEEDMAETVALELRCGYAHRFIPFLKDIIDEECEESPRAEELLEKLKAYQPEIPETAVPVVRINFCEDKEMDISGYQKLGTLDETTAKMDAELASKADSKTGMPEKTVQMYFTIYYPDHNQMQELKGKINIGDGNGGIVSQLKNQNEMKLHDESWLNYQKGKGEESFQAYLADLTDMKEHVLPYLQSFCSLEEKAPEKSVEPTTMSKSEVEAGKTITSGKNEKAKPVELVKKSIHERLKINKEIIAKQQGKDEPERGVGKDLRTV